MIKVYKTVHDDWRVLNSDGDEMGLYNNERDAWHKAYTHCLDPEKRELFKQYVLDRWIDTDAISYNAAHLSWQDTEMVYNYKASWLFLMHAPAIWLILADVTSECGYKNIPITVGKLTPSHNDLNDEIDVQSAMAWIAIDWAFRTISYEYCEHCNERHNSDDCSQGE